MITGDWYRQVMGNDISWCQ